MHFSNTHITSKLLLVGLLSYEHYTTAISKINHALNCYWKYILSSGFTSPHGWAAIFHCTFFMWAFWSRLQLNHWLLHTGQYEILFSRPQDPIPSSDDTKSCGQYKHTGCGHILFGTVLVNKGVNRLFNGTTSIFVGFHWQKNPQHFPSWLQSRQITTTSLT